LRDQQPRLNRNTGKCEIVSKRIPDMNWAIPPEKIIAPEALMY